MYEKYVLSALVLGFTSLAHALCPESPVPLCEIVAAHPFVAHARVSSTQYLVDEDDPAGVAGTLYHLDVIRDYRQGKAARRTVYGANTTARLTLKTGKEYIVFAAPDAEGNLAAGNYCDAYTEAGFTPELEKQVLACLARKTGSGTDIRPPSP